MNHLLFVDDEPNVLDAFRRSVGRTFKIETAVGGAAALEIMDKSGPFAVIVSDMRMPQMDGIQFMCAARRKSPDSVYLMLTGNSDQQTAVDALNRGQVFRFLNKPVDHGLLDTTLRAAIRQHELVTAERQLLETTLMGAVDVLGEVLSLSHPSMSARCTRIRTITVHTVRQLDLPDPWRYELAAQLSSVGYLVLPASLLAKAQSGASLTEDEQRALDGYPKIGGRLIERVPRLEETARMIASSGEPDGALPDDLRDERARVQVGAAILRAALALDAQLCSGLQLDASLTVLHRQRPAHDPRLLAAMAGVNTDAYGRESRLTVRKLACAELRPGMILEQGVRSPTNLLLLGVGIELTEPLIERLRALHELKELKEPISVLCSPLRVSS